MKQPTIVYVDPRDRIEALVLKHIDETGELLDAHTVAMELIDEDVAAGLYDGCSTELDLCASEYISLAERILR